MGEVNNPALANGELERGTPITGETDAFEGESVHVGIEREIA